MSIGTKPTRVNYTSQTWSKPSPSKSLFRADAKFLPHPRAPGSPDLHA